MLSFIKNIGFFDGLKFIFIAFLFFFTYLMYLITIQYIPIDDQAAFLFFKEEEIELPYYKIAFFSHVYSSIFVLFFGIFQFVQWIRNKAPKFHRFAGKIYIGFVLLLAAPSGFIMGIHGNGGIYSQISFCLLSTLWFYFTLIGFMQIKKRNFKLHLNYMILSYALTLSAISLRLFKWGITNFWHLPPMDTYKIVVWLGWLFNLLVALVIIQYRKNKKA